MGIKRNDYIKQYQCSFGHIVPPLDRLQQLFYKDFTVLFLLLEFVGISYATFYRRMTLNVSHVLQIENVCHDQTDTYMQMVQPVFLQNACLHQNNQ